MLAKRLKLLRKERRVYQRELAEYLGITLRTYQCSRDGAHGQSIKGLIALADFFDVTIDYLVGRTDRRM